MDTDLKLVSRYLAGDLSAFETLFERHERQVYSFAFHMTGDRVEADDLCQEIWLAAIQSLAGFQGRAPFRAWMHGVAVNVSRHRHRTKRVPSVPFDEESAAQQGGGDPQAAAAAAEARVVIGEALALLPEEQREVVVLHELQGFSYAEIGRMTGCPNGTVKSRLHYAMQSLRRTLRADLQGGRKNHVMRPGKERP